MSYATIEYRAEIVRIRHDRQHPNALWVAQSIFESICENITCELLQQNIDLCIQNNNNIHDNNDNAMDDENEDRYHNNTVNTDSSLIKQGIMQYGRSIACQM